MSNAMAFGLVFLWIGAMALGALVVMRDRWAAAAARHLAVPDLSVRKSLEAFCLFAGPGGMILGLGLIGLGTLR